MEPPASAHLCPPTTTATSFIRPASRRISSWRAARQPQNSSAIVDEGAEQEGLTILPSSSTVAISFRFASASSGDNFLPCYLFGFFLFGILFASWCSRRRLVVVRPSAGPPSRNRSLVVVCCMLCVYVWGLCSMLSLSRFVSGVCFLCCLDVLSRCVVSVCCLGVCFLYGSCVVSVCVALVS